MEPYQQIPRASRPEAQAVHDTSPIDLGNETPVKVDGPQQSAAVFVEAYAELEQQVRQSDEELRKLSKEARSLGRSMSILGISNRLRERLDRILRLFRQNVLMQCPQEMRENVHFDRTPINFVHRRKVQNFLGFTANSHVLNTPKPVGLAQEFRKFVEDVKTLTEIFSQYPEFSEELPESFLVERLQEYALMLEDNSKLERTSGAFSRLLVESMEGVAATLKTLSKDFIPVFTKIGIPTLKASRDHGASNLGNQTLVAALFAGVATGMIQVFSSGNSASMGTMDGLNNWIVLLWYMTLILSVASAVYGLLGMSWMQAIYRTPDSHVPWWVLMWIKGFPLISLVLAVGCFFVALILFAFTQKQNGETRIFITILSSSSCVGLIIVSLWFSCELLAYNIYGGQKWLVDVFTDVNVVAFIQSYWLSIKHGRRDGPTAWKTGHDSDLVYSITGPPMLARSAQSITGPPMLPRSAQHWRALNSKVLYRDERGETSRTYRRGFADVVYQVRPHLRHGIEHNFRPAFTVHLVASKVGAPVHALRFSARESALLAVCRRHRTLPQLEVPLNVISIINTEYYGECGELKHPDSGGDVLQTEWCPNGRRLLVRSHAQVSVWVCDAVRETHLEATLIQRLPSPQHPDHRLYSASWKDDMSFICVEGRQTLAEGLSELLALDGCTPYLQFRHLCVVQSTTWMIGAGYHVDENQEVPRRSYILVWDLNGFKIVKKVPMSHTISSIALASNGKSILVSFENKAASQHWHLITNRTAAYLVFCECYTLDDNVDFSDLPSVFGGEDDIFVLRITLEGNIHVWIRDSAQHIHCIIRPPAVQGQITCFTATWNQSQRKSMLATGMQDGTVYIWEDSQKSPDTQGLTATDVHQVD